jgi:hypothetical protein
VQGAELWIAFAFKLYHRNHLSFEHHRAEKKIIKPVQQHRSKKMKVGEGCRNYAVGHKTILAYYYVATMERVQYNNYEQAAVNDSEIRPPPVS